MIFPVAPESFDAVTIAFGIRNIADKLSALKAFHGSLRKGGMLLVLELTTPASGFFRSLYLWKTMTFGIVTLYVRHKH